MGKIKVKLFGVFRELSELPYLELACEQEILADELKQHVIELILNIEPTFNLAILNSSVLANGNNIISENTLVDVSKEVSFFPPVCGG